MSDRQVRQRGLRLRVERGSRRTGDGGRWRVVLGQGEAAAGQDVLLLQVLQLQDVHLTFN